MRTTTSSPGLPEGGDRLGISSEVVAGGTLGEGAARLILFEDQHLERPRSSGHSASSGPSRPSQATRLGLGRGASNWLSGDHGRNAVLCAVR